MPKVEKGLLEEVADKEKALELLQMFLSAARQSEVAPLSKLGLLVDQVETFLNVLQTG